MFILVKLIIQLVFSISSFQLITKIATVMSCISFYLLQGVGMETTNQCGGRKKTSAVKI